MSQMKYKENSRFKEVKKKLKRKVVPDVNYIYENKLLMGSEKDPSFHAISFPIIPVLPPINRRNIQKPKKKSV
jgi:hypothetical protein